MSVGAKVVDSGVRYCVVCGNGSHRTDWVRKSGDSVACDFHSDAEFQKAIAARSQAPAQAQAAKAPGAPAAPATAFKKG